MSTKKSYKKTTRKTSDLKRKAATSEFDGGLLPWMSYHTGELEALNIEATDHLRELNVMMDQIINALKSDHISLPPKPDDHDDEAMKMPSNAQTFAVLMDQQTFHLRNTMRINTEKLQGRLGTILNILLGKDDS